MKFLIVGLGNMHPDYDNTRHNVGFDVLDAIAESKGSSFKNDQYGDLCEVTHKGRKLILLKPSLYMNRSGKSVRYWLQKTKVIPKNLLIIVDDIHLPLGSMRLRPKGGDGGHNGLKDIESHLHSQDYARLRIGIGNGFSKGNQANFVLSEWSSKERLKLPEILDMASKAVLSFSFAGIRNTMNQFNSKTV